MSDSGEVGGFNYHNKHVNKWIKIDKSTCEYLGVGFFCFKLIIEFVLIAKLIEFIGKLFRIIWYGFA